MSDTTTFQIDINSNRQVGFENFASDALKNAGTYRRAKRRFTRRKQHLCFTTQYSSDYSQVCHQQNSTCIHQLQYPANVVRHPVARVLRKLPLLPRRFGEIYTGTFYRTTRD